MKLRKGLLVNLKTPLFILDAHFDGRSVKDGEFFMVQYIYEEFVELLDNQGRLYLINLKNIIGLKEKPKHKLTNIFKQRDF